ncbi:MAG: 16S rRNA (cytosine(1402)-N(4))-methyltransferase RsmH [Alphaproteobacteria bacterium]|nr:16S rRNA (cytosine(1402)-N(4))-methyltransferase RsmH [Alphaproteobacteria bacterium]
MAAELVVIAPVVERGHTPVLLDEVLAALAPRDGADYVDGTFGRGGYAEAILKKAECRVWGIDRDPEAIAAGATLAKHFPGRLTVIEGRFGAMDQLMAERGITRVDGIALDLGVSSPQIDNPNRGFSFRQDGPLDMRMEGRGPTAADIVNGADEGELADIIFRFGEERRARAVARAIVRARPFQRTFQLADVVRRAVPRSNDGIDPATRTFQALRVFINDELDELDRGLAAAERLLAPGGRLAVVSFHSLEDRVVKTFLARRSGHAGVSRHLPATRAARPTFTDGSRKAIRPSAQECAANPRARSAKLRWAIRTDAVATESVQ